MGVRVDAVMKKGEDSESHQPDEEKAAWKVQSKSNQVTRKNVD